MRTRERLCALEAWVYENLCRGREMKAPGENFDITQIRRQEPRVFIGWQPMHPDESGLLQSNPLSVCPSITIMPLPSYAKRVEERRFDRYNGVSRPRELGQTLCVDMLFSVYEPGIRLPGFIDSADDPNGLDMTKLIEGTREGLFTLYDWMDDCVSRLLADMNIPHSDLFVHEEQLVSSLYMDQSFAVDKRPVYYGFVRAEFGCHADDRCASQIEKMLL